MHQAHIYKYRGGPQPQLYRENRRWALYTNIYVHNIFNTPPPSRSGARDAGTGTELLEGGSRQSLRHHISELLRNQNMEDPNTSKGHLLAHKVNVQLIVLSPAMMNGVGGKVHRRNVVTVDNRSLGDVMMQLLK